MKILGVGLLDWQIMGREAFIVQTGDDEVTFFEVTTKGQVTPTSPPQPKIAAIASVEKWNHGYLLGEPVEISALSELAAWIGKFEATSDTDARRI